MKALLVGTLLIITAGSVSALGQVNACAVTAVGFQVTSFGNTQVAVWYPSSGAEARYVYSDTMAGSVVVNGRPDNCIRPLVVFSHGNGSCGTRYAFITEQLARNGYIVAAPDHADATCSSSEAGPTGSPPAAPGAPETWTDQSYTDRRADIVKTIDGMLASSVFGGSIDAQRIAGAGHSLGGYTILAMAGAWSTWFEPRIKAAVLMAPVSQPFLTKATLGGVRIPVQYQGGMLDVLVPVQKVADSYEQTPASPSKFFLNLRGAMHGAWTNANSSCVAAGAGTVQDCLKTFGNAGLIDSYALDFLGRYLLGQASPLLWEPGVMLADYRRESAARLVNAASFRAGAPVAANSIAASNRRKRGFHRSSIRSHGTGTYCDSQRKLQRRR